MASKKESPSTSTHQPAIVTRTSPRIAKPNLESDSDPQQPPVNVARSSSGNGKAKVGSDPKLPKPKKVQTKTSDRGGGEASSKGFKKKANSGPAAIVTQSSARLRGKGKVDSNVPSDSVSQPPKSEKGEENASGGGGGGGKSSSLGSKKKANSGPAAIVTRSSAQQRGKGKVDSKVPSDSVSQPPKSEKGETNTSGGGGGKSSSMDSKNKANTETAAIVTQRSTRQQSGKTNTTAGVASASATAARRGKEIPKSPIAIVVNPKSSPNTRSSSTKGPKTTSNERNATISATAKKRLNMEPSSSSARRDKGKAKYSEQMLNVENNRAIEKALKDNDFPRMFKPVRITTSEVNAVLARATRKKRAVVQPPSSVLTRHAKAKMSSDSTPSANNPRLPKSQKAKSTSSTSVSTRRGKPKIDSDPQPKPNKAKATASTSGSTPRGKPKMGSNPTPPANPEPPKPNKVKATASTSGSTSRGKAQTGSNPTPPRSTTRGNSAVSATPRNKKTMEPSSRVLRSGKKN